MEVAREAGSWHVGGGGGVMWLCLRQANQGGAHLISQLLTASYEA